ncbi:MAG: transcription-repair coupling factor [Geminicoccaceae bacterium]|nr:transcription-repair coupling factor [Geminicoccaceae bacterium]
MTDQALIDEEAASEEAQVDARRGSDTLVTNARSGVDARFIASLLEPGRTLVCVTRDAQRSDALADLVRFFADDVEVLSLPAWDCLPYDRVSPSRAVMAARLAALAALAAPAKKPRLLLVSANALIQRLPPREAVAAGHFRLEAGARVDREALTVYLERNGYRRSGAVVEAGEYAVRGGLLDIFATGARLPVRLDFFGDTLEVIRTFDPVSQRTRTKIPSVDLTPVSEVLFDERALERFRRGYLKAFGAVGDDPLLEAVASGRSFPGMEHWLPLFHESTTTLFDHLDGPVEIVFDHLALDALWARASLIGEHYEARLSPEMAGRSMGSVPYRALEPHTLYLDEQQLRGSWAPHRRWRLTIFDQPVEEGGTASVLDLQGRAGRDFARERADRSINLFDAIVGHLGDLKQAGRSPILAAHGEGAADRLAQVLVDHGLDAPRRITRFAEHVEGTVAVAVLPLEESVHAEGLTLLGERDLLGERLTRAAAKRRRADKFIQNVGTLAENDLVVHAEHGIGRFEGLVTLEVGGAPHDCLKLIYAGGDKLFVPVESIDILSRYGTREGEGQLDKLGGVGWQNRKARVKQRIREMAEELIAIAAARATREGEAFQLPPGMYEEFAARFPFDETDDQLAAIEAVLTDLASGKPMDRLICGFGKTEVAIRAAFVVALSGKQVAILAPTTLLARQHFNVFAKRLEGLPIRVEHLSRFVATKKQTEVKKDLAAGRVDIVVGTHALLGKNVAFRDLGLVVVDEEQHFGVAHKERLKQMRAQVHVLTMTATPIPRTLHMALGGMKDLSIIATPPADRLAVRSFVMPADPVVLREAILREHHRGGQTFYVCPRVSDQPRLKQDLERLVPEITIAVANGQMPARDLEDVMAAFYDRQVDLLLATNIIESGLDIPSANTLIVHRADMFGLSQLYQLRGRVGRSKTRGYAYFTVPTNKVLQEAAEKRLQVIQSLEGLGAGFQLASHDLDIRGAGNLLGDEQSGQIREVGFELYNHMLEEAVAALKSRAAGEAEGDRDWTPQITVDAAALMPETYIADLELRLTMYRRLAGLENEEEIEAFAAELIDRFGPLPEETEHLLQIVAIKQLCRSANVQKLDVGPKGVVLGFHNNTFPRPERLVQHIGASKGRMRVRPDHRVVILRETATPKDRLKIAKRTVDELARLVA